MKKFLATLLMALASFAFAGPYDLLLNQRNATDDGNILRIPAHPSTCGPLFFDAATLLPQWYTLGSGLSCSGGVLDTTASAPSWSTLTGKPSWTSTFDGSFASLASKPSTLAGYGITDAYPLSGNPSGFLTGVTSGQVTSALGYTPYSASNPAGYIAGISGSMVTTALGLTPVDQAGARSAISLTTTGSGAATYNSTTGVLNVPTPATPSRSFAYTTRSLNTCYQISATRDALVSYAVDIATSLSLVAGQQGTVYLRTYTNSSCTTGAQELTRFVNGQTGTLTIGLALSQNVTGTLTGIVPAGAYVQQVTENNTGTPTFTARPGQEVLF